MTNGTRRGWGVSSRPICSILPGKTRYPSGRRLGGPQGWSGEVRKISPTTGIQAPDLPVRSQPLYLLSYPAHTRVKMYFISVNILSTLLINRNVKGSVPSRMCSVMSSEDGLDWRKHVQTKLIFLYRIVYFIVYCFGIIFRGLTVLVGQTPLSEVPRSHSDTPHSVGLLWMSDQPVAVTPNWQHTTL
jgi:hypothetical protein